MATARSARDSETWPTTSRGCWRWEEWRRQQARPDHTFRQPCRGGVPEVFMASTVVHVSAHHLVTAPETDVALVAARFTCNTSVGTSSPSSSKRSSSWRLAAISAPAFLASVLWSTKRATPEGISSIEPLSARCQLHRRAACLSSNEHH